MSDEKEDSGPSYAAQRATAQTWEQVYNANANEIFEIGVKNIPGFEQKVQALKDNGVMSPDLVVLLQQCDNPPAVLDRLGSEEDLAYLKNLNSVQLAKVLSAADEGRTYKPRNPTPNWKLPKSELNDSLTDREFSAAWDRKFGKKR
jgi:hypothetical protein